jgi:hypothetical protein
LWSRDGLRGHQLLEAFVEDHGLPWNRVLDDESGAETQERSGRQLRELLWAGLNALAALAGACALAWLAARKPDVLETARGEALLAKVADDVAAFRMVANAQLMEIGPNPIRAAIAELSMSGAIRRSFEAFAGALDVTWADDSDDGDYESACEEMGETLEVLLAGDGVPLRAVREVVRVLSPRGGTDPGRRWIRDEVRAATSRRRRSCPRISFRTARCMRR